MPRIFLALAAALTLLAAVPLPPAPTRYVTDAAGVIPDDREAALNAKLEQHDRETSNQLLVYIDHKVPAGTTIEQMGVEAIRAWKVGQAKKDNGAILFLFIDDRESRIEVGYGLEGVLTDARSKQILVDLRTPLQNADYASAAELGASRIIEVVTDPEPSYTPEAIEKSQREAVEARAAEIAAREEKLIIPSILFGIALFSFIFYALYRAFIVGDWKFGSSGGSSSSASSSSSSSSGFSGGGGSGGGGGASDRW